MNRLKLIAGLLLLLPMAVGAQPYVFGTIPWAEAAEGDSLHRVYPVNYHIELTDSSGNEIRMGDTEHYPSWTPKILGTGGQTEAGNTGKVYAFQINGASGQDPWDVTPASATHTDWAWTIPIPVSGFVSATIQSWVCNATGGPDDTPSATPEFNFHAGAGAIDSVSPFYDHYGDANGVIMVRGSLMPESDHLLHGLSVTGPAHSVDPNEVAFATACVTAPFYPIPDETYLNGRYSGGISAGAVANVPGATYGWIYGATYPLTELGIFHYPTRGLNQIDLVVTSNSVTRCILVRLNRNIVSDTATRGISYP